MGKIKELFQKLKYSYVSFGGNAFLMILPMFLQVMGINLGLAELLKRLIASIIIYCQVIIREKKVLLQKFE